MKIKAVRKKQGYQRKDGYHWLLEVDGKPPYGKTTKDVGSLEEYDDDQQILINESKEIPKWNFSVFYPYLVIAKKLGVDSRIYWGDIPEQEALEKAITICEKLAENYRGEKP